MIDYVYNGEVNIEQDQLDRFLTIAQRFQLEGLISDKSDILTAYGANNVMKIPCCAVFGSQ